MAAVFGLGLIMDGDVTRYHVNNKFQLQEVFQGVLASPYPQLDLVENFGIFEKTIKAFIHRPSGDIEKMSFSILPGDSVTVHITTNDIITPYVDTTIMLPK